jgi:hypothetical protein
MKNTHTLAWIALLLASILTGLGGWLDMTGQATWMGISREHAWHDGLFLVLLAIALLQF